MKKNILLLQLILLISFAAFSQTNKFVQFSLDPKVILSGVKNTDVKSLNFQIKAFVGNDKHEVGAYVERHKHLRYTGVGALYHYKINLNNKVSLYHKAQALIGIDAGYIFRNFSSLSMSLTAALNAELRYWIGRRIGLSASSSYRLRGDLADLYQDKTPYVFSGYLGVLFRL